MMLEWRTEVREKVMNIGPQLCAQHTLSLRHNMYT